MTSLAKKRQWLEPVRAGRGLFDWFLRQHDDDAASKWGVTNLPLVRYLKAERVALLRKRRKRHCDEEETTAKPAALTKLEAH